jgi:hypothetical protein
MSFAAMLFNGDQSAFGEDLDMFGYRRTADMEFISDRIQV